MHTCTKVQGMLQIHTPKNHSLIEKSFPDSSRYEKYTDMDTCTKVRKSRRILACTPLISSYIPNCLNLGKLLRLEKTLAIIFKSNNHLVSRDIPP